jgi:hypothetical protein
MENIRNSSGQYRFLGFSLSSLVIGVMTLLGTVLLPRSVSAEKAPEGKFLPNTTLVLPQSEFRKKLDLPPRTIAPPDYQFETRLGWLAGSHAGYYTKWFGAYKYLAQLDATPEYITSAIRDEVKRIDGLPEAERQEYLLGMMRDQATLELAELNDDWYKQVFASAFMDVLSSLPTSKGLEALKVPGLGSAAGGAAASAVAGGLVGGNPSRIHREARLKALREYVRRRCGCMDPGGDQFKAPEHAWQLVMPNVRESYGTGLGRILATYGKGKRSDFRPAIPIAQWFDQRQTLLNAEMAKITNWKEKDPATHAAYLIRFLYDIENVQKELMEDADTTTGSEYLASFLTSLAAGTIGGFSVTTLIGLKSPQNLYIDGVGSLLSAIGSGGLQWGKLSEKKQLILTMAAVRNMVLRLITSYSGDCGCKPAAKMLPFEERDCPPCQEFGKIGLLSAKVSTIEDFDQLECTYHLLFDGKWQASLITLLFGETRALIARGNSVEQAKNKYGEFRAKMKQEFEASMAKKKPESVTVDFTEAEDTLEIRSTEMIEGRGTIRFHGRLGFYLYKNCLIIIETHKDSDEAWVIRVFNRLKEDMMSLVDKKG